MRLKYIWIENYQKYHNTEVLFDREKEQSSLQKKIFKNMNVVLLSGENGSGKTTILSFISYAFRYLQRFRERLESDYYLVYEMKIGNKNFIVELEKIKTDIYIKENGEKYYVQEYKIGKNKGYCYNKNVSNYIKQVTYEDIKKYLPNKIYVLGFDSAYSKLTYATNYIGDQLVEYRDLQRVYDSTARGSYNSQGILYFYYMYYGNSQLRHLINSWGIKLADYIDIYIDDGHALPQDDDEFGTKYYGQFKRYKEETAYLDGIVNFRKLRLEEYLLPREEGMHPYNERLAIRDFLSVKPGRKYRILKEIMDSWVIYINEFYIVKNGINIPISKMSTGEKAFLFNLFEVCSDVKDNTMIIWEEPETHLNMKWSKNLIPLLVSLFSKKDAQWFFSSHSSYMIKNLFQNQVLRLLGDSIENPDFNTFLSNDADIYNKLFGDKEINPFEKTVIKELSENLSDKEEILSEIGDSYLKFMIYQSMG